MGAKAAVDQAAALAAEIRAYCQANANPQLALKYARFFREGYDAWGFWDPKDALWTVKEPEWFERYRGLGLRGFLKLGELLFASGKYEEGALAIRFLRNFRDQMNAAAVARLARWFDGGIRNWAHTDVLCSELLSPLMQCGKIGLDAIAGWRTSPHRFQRRAVPVGMLGLLKADTAIPPLLEFIRPMMEDGERVVHQGLGWFLREAWKKDPKPVESFLMEWKERAPRLIFQYATEKMTPAARARFRRSTTRAK
ncbi:MAG TPA: DNA alkylation repair protein [Bryobacteraceae bacterium]|nr:DNA alkylation repair protein [Bryobacteraceae bacterium]